jgi:type II secretory pathway component PulF
MFAQSFAEYGSLVSVISQVERVVYNATDWVQRAGPGVWLALVVVVAAFLLFRRRRGV